MDKYSTVHGQDVFSFDLDATHRLPTVSAAQASADLDDSSQVISSGLETIDLDGGIRKGEVTEIWGPPGAGKTAFGLQLAGEVLGEGSSVVWIDGFHPVCIERLAARIRHQGKTEAGAANRPLQEQLASFVHYTCPTLSHFLAVLCRATAKSLPASTGLVVIDSLSSLVNHAFPRASEPKRRGQGPQGFAALSRRLPVLEYIVNALQKVAATRNLAVVILTQCATRMKVEHGAALIPAINASVWDQGISMRIVLFRDWIWRDGELVGMRFAGLAKSAGKRGGGGRLSADHPAAFTVDDTGIVPVVYEAGYASTRVSSRPAPRRTLDGTESAEIADSDEDYGWQDEDAEALPRMPPQWQGSEDILLGQTSDGEVGGEDDGSEPDDHDLPGLESHRAAAEETE